MFASSLRYRRETEKKILAAIGDITAVRNVLLETPGKSFPRSYTGESFEDSALEYQIDPPGAKADTKLRLRFLPGVFIQVNWPQNVSLIAYVMKAVEKLARNAEILELHGGAGNFTVPLAASGYRVTSVEVEPRAVLNVRLNLRENGLEGVTLIRRKTEDALAKDHTLKRTFDAVLADPPRTGMKREIEYLAKLDIPYIIYVSCDPATLARDVGRLQKHGYALDRIQPFDLFPQTYHGECVCTMSRR